MKLLILLFSFIKISFAGYIGLKTITTDGYITDWTNNTGLHFLSENTCYVTDNQYIWQDAFGDDKGDGDYVYPTNSAFGESSADIDQFRVCWDDEYVYFMMRLHNGTGEWWASAFFIGIDTGSPDNGMVTFIEGDGSSFSNGPAVELKCNYPKIDYLLFCSATYRAILWDKNGNIIGDGHDPDNSDGSLNNIYIKARVWNEYEIAVPVSLIGSPKNSTWHFLAGSGFEENKMFRETQGYPLITEWYFTGGDDTWWNNTSPDPDVCDLIGADKTLQEKDLANYNPSGTPGDTNSFSTITNSFVTVADYNKFCIYPESIYATNNQVIELSILGCNSISTGEFLNNDFKVTLYGDIGTFSSNRFYAKSSFNTNLLSGYITFEKTGVTTFTLFVKITNTHYLSVGEETFNQDNVAVQEQFADISQNEITFKVLSSAPSTVYVTIYSIDGRIVKKFQQNIEPGENYIKWVKDTEGGFKAGSGLYIFKFEFNNKKFIKKVLIVN